MYGAGGAGHNSAAEAAPLRRGAQSAGRWGAARAVAAADRDFRREEKKGGGRPPPLPATAGRGYRGRE